MDSEYQHALDTYGANCQAGCGQPARFVVRLGGMDEDGRILGRACCREHLVPIMVVTKHLGLRTVDVLET